MYRKNDDKLDHWLKKKGRKPLLLRGARQVGKSTIVRQFAARNNLDLIEINLERQPQMDEVFGSLDVKRILHAIESLPKIGKVSGNSVLFLDEIQATPNALAALRYFYEEWPDLPVIAAGSLLEFVLNDHKFSMPVGRIEYLHMHPMSFEEFLIARDAKKLVLAIETMISTQKVEPFVHQQICDHLKYFLFVGGMPEAIKVFIETDSLRDVSDVHSSILDTYKDDFAKYAKKQDLLLLHRALAYGARAVGERVKYVEISRDEPSRTLKYILDLLCYAKLMDRVYHSDANAVPLGVDMNDKVFKLLFLDVGLMNASNKLDWRSISDASDLTAINSGKVSEQFVGQELRREHDLFFWVRDGKAGNAEVDYVVNSAQQIIPIEVKSGKSGRLRSLLSFAQRGQPKLLLRFDTNLPSLQKITLDESPSQRKGRRPEVDLLSLPLYAAGFFSRSISG